MSRVDMGSGFRELADQQLGEMERFGLLVEIKSTDTAVSLSRATWIQSV